MEALGQYPVYMHIMPTPFVDGIRGPPTRPLPECRGVPLPARNEGVNLGIPLKEAIGEGFSRGLSISHSLHLSHQQVQILSADLWPAKEAQRRFLREAEAGRLERGLWRKASRPSRSQVSK